MSSFTRRAAVTTIALGVLTGTVGASQALADEAPEAIELKSTSLAAATQTPAPTAPTPTSEPPAPTSEQPAPPATPPAAPPAAPSPSASATPAADGSTTISLSGFTPGSSLSASLVGNDGTMHDASGAFDAPLAADTSGSYSGRLNGAGFPPGQYALTIRQPDGVSASVAVAIVAPPANTGGGGETQPSSPAQPPAEVTGPTASAAKPAFRPDEEITYIAQGFTPGEAINATVSFPDGSSVAAEGDGSGADANGAYAGKLSYTGTLPAGNYTVRVFQASGPEASFSFEIIQIQADPGAPATGAPSAAPGAPVNPDLARTGPGEPFGAAGLGLLLIAGGTAALATRRFVARGNR